MTRTVCALGPVALPRRAARSRRRWCARAPRARPATGCSSPTIRRCSPSGAAASGDEPAGRRARRSSGSASRCSRCPRRRRHLARARASWWATRSATSTARDRDLHRFLRGLEQGADRRAGAAGASRASASPGRTGVWVAEREDRLHRHRRAALGQLPWLRAQRGPGPEVLRPHPSLRASRHPNDVAGRAAGARSARSGRGAGDVSRGAGGAPGLSTASHGRAGSARRLAAGHSAVMPTAAAG